MNTLYHYGFLISFAVCFFPKNISAAPKFVSIKENQSQIGKFEKYELTVDVRAKFKNPYDPKEVSLKAIFKSPSGITKIVNGFFYKEFEILPQSNRYKDGGKDAWKVRFTPNEIGKWTYHLMLSDSTGTSDSPVQSFDCITSFNNGFVRKSNTNYLKFDSGLNYFPVGENVGWYGHKKIDDYKQWINELAENGGNFLRLWMCSWGTGIEWKETGLGDYSKRQDRAFELDWIIDYASQKGIYIMLCLNNHGQVSTYVNSEWDNNPYNSKNGGPCKNTFDFFSDSSAIKFYLRRLNYIVARWGYSPNILAWEIFNEIEFTNSYLFERKNIIAWQKMNAIYLDSLDVNNHLITTSYASSEKDFKLWKLPEIDFTQTHFYRGSSDIESIQIDGIKNYLTSFEKPTLVGEFGLWSRDESFAEMDPKGITLHNSLWASTVSGSFGTSMIWWWDSYVHPFKLYKYFQPVNHFTSTIDYLNEDYKPAGGLNFESENKADLIITPGYNSFGKSPGNYFIIDSTGGIDPVSTQYGAVLFSKEWINYELRNPPTFEIENDKPGKFSAVVGDTSNNSRICIKLNGVVKLDQLARRDSIYIIDLPAGKQKITLDNSGEEWVKLSAIEISDFMPALKGFASIGRKSIIGWLHNRNYNWKYVRKHGEPEKINGRVTINGITNGNYKIEMIDCRTGEVSASFIQPVTNNLLTLKVENLNWSCAFKAQYVEPLKQRTETTLPPVELVKHSPEVFGIDEKKIEVKINEAGNVKLTFLNYLGRQIDFVSKDYYQLGAYTIKLNSELFQPGFYFLKLSSGNYTGYEKFLIIEELINENSF